MADDERQASIEDLQGLQVPVSPPKDERAKQELHALAHEAEQFRNELGWMGKPFGGKAEKPGNISAIVILFCFAGMAFVYARPPGQDSGISFERVFGGLVSIVTLILGYLFGSHERSDK